jgi:hypothetical protein
MPYPVAAAGYLQAWIIARFTDLDFPQIFQREGFSFKGSRLAGAMPFQTRPNPFDCSGIN